MFAFQNVDGKWWIAGKQYKEDIFAKDRGGGFISSMSPSQNFEDTKWDDATISLISKEPYYSKQPFISRVAEEIANNVHNQDETYGEKEIIRQANGEDTISRVVINLDCGYQFVQITNDSRHTYKEVCNFPKFDNCLLMPPFSGNKYTVTVP